MKKLLKKANVASFDESKEDLNLNLKLFKDDNFDDCFSLKIEALNPLWSSSLEINGISPERIDVLIMKLNEIKKALLKSKEKQEELKRA